MPPIVAGIACWITLKGDWYPGQGKTLFRTLSGVSTFFVFFGGVRHASKAVCWEVSVELRDLVRLTGIAPATLLWCQTFCRWWTIFLSILLIFPLAIFAETLGGGTADQWIALVSWLMLVAVLTAGFAMIASVSSGRASNADTTAATATFLMMVFYHFIFWGFGIAIWLAAWLIHGRFELPFGSLGRDVAEFAFKLPPLIGIYQSFTTPTLFSPLRPTYWVHFLTGICCLRMASIVMRNRFRVTTQGDRDVSESVTTTMTKGTQTFAPLRPRCSDRPFFWKDKYILGGGKQSQTWWATYSFVAVIGVIFLAMYGGIYNVGLPMGIIAICVTPWIVAFRFDSLMAAEFREQMWNSLTILPIDPRVPILAKLQAAISERQAIFFPVGLAALIACTSDATAVLMAGTIALLMGVLLVQISILSQFNAKVWWAGPAVGSLVIVLLGIVLTVWLSFERITSFVITVAMMGAAIVGFFSHINWRLRNWTDA